jgi:acetylglutamate/LysW-gamma-L-alpha-aminoadipate kinase
MIIVKIGGGESINIEFIIADLKNFLQTSNEECVIVHGANALRDNLAKQLNYEKVILTSVSGYSSVYSDEEAINLQMMAYAGHKNKRIVETCQKHGINAIGLTGLDGKVVQGKRNQGIRVKEGEKIKIKRDFSGKPQTLNSELLKLLLINGYTPVLTVPIIDENNFAINSENDDIVALLHQHLQAKSIFQLIEAPGLLRDFNDKTSVIKKMTKIQLDSLEEKAEGRIKRKLLALKKLLDYGSTIVYLTDGTKEHPITSAIAGNGTIIE